MGSSEDEVLIVAHACHPSLCDDNLSGISIATLLARDLSAGPPLRHSVRFLFAPGTIGAIAWLARNTESLEKITAGLTLTCSRRRAPLHVQAHPHRRHPH